MSTSDVQDLEFVKELIEAEDETNDLITELRYEPVGAVIEFEENALPTGWVVKVADNSTSMNYDSYGNGYNRDAYVVLEVSDGSDSALYKIPGTYESYEGWNWDLNGITKVTKREKVVTSYEWASI